MLRDNELAFVYDVLAHAEVEWDGISNAGGAQLRQDIMAKLDRYFKCHQEDPRHAKP